MEGERINFRHYEFKGGTRKKKIEALTGEENYGGFLRGGYFPLKAISPRKGAHCFHYFNAVSEQHIYGLRHII